MYYFKALALLVVPALFSGCVAMQKDLDPMRSDISVLEKQFVELQREVSKARFQAEDGQGAPVLSEMGDRVSDVHTRLSAIEKRLDALEARIRELRQSQGVTAPQPMAPEPVVVEPIGEAPATP